MRQSVAHGHNNEWLTLFIAFIAPILLAVHLYRIQHGYYATGDTESINLPAYWVMLTTSLVGATLAFKSPWHKSLVTIAARLTSMTSIVFLAILAIPLFLLAGFGPS